MSSARSAAFVSASQAGKLVLSVVSLVVLSRLLPPEDFGVFAMIIAVVGIGELFRDFGLSLAAIQAESISTRQRTDLFWANLAIGGALTVIACAASPLIAGLYGRPGLAPQVCVVAATFLLNGAGAQYRVELTRRGAYRDLAVVDLLGLSVSLAGAIVLALLGLGAWALVLQAVLLSAVMLAVLVAAGRWAPGRPGGMAAIRSFLGFGGQLLSVQVVSYLSSNLDKVLVGRLFGPTSLGLYAKAFQLYSQPITQGVAPFTNLAVSLLSKARGDRDGYLRRLLKLQLVAGYLGLAGFAMMIGLAEPLVAVVLGPAWAGSVPLFRILCVGGLFQILGFVYYWMFLSADGVRAYLICTFITQPLAIALVALGATQGTAGVAWGSALGFVAEWLVPAVWGARAVLGAARVLLVNNLRPLATAATTALAGFGGTQLVRPLPSVVQLLVGAVLAGAAVALLVLVVPALRRDAGMLAGLVGEAVGRRRRRAAPAAPQGVAEGDTPAAEAVAVARTDSVSRPTAISR